MIFVILGSQDKSFIRLLEEIERQIELGVITEKVIVQAGVTKYSSKNMEILDFIPMNKFKELIKQADIIITHGGVGSILDGLKENKKIIVAPRLKEYKEHVNNHQIQIVEEFEKEGYIIKTNITDLNEALIKVKKFTPKEYKSNNYKFTNMIYKGIEELTKK